MIRSAPATLNMSAIEPRRDRLAAAVLLVLAGVAPERHDHGDPLGRRALQRVHHDQLLHDLVVDRGGVALQDERVAAAHRLLEPHEDLAVGEGVGRLRGDRDVELLGDLLGQLGVGPSGEEHEALLRHGRPGTHCWFNLSVAALCGLGGRRVGAVLLHPALDVALGPTGHGQRARRHVLLQDGARPGVGAVADGDRRDELRVGAGADVRADHRAVLAHAVVVDERRAGADVGVLADRGVADVGQVRHLRALADLGVLDLDERADLAALAEPRPRVAGRRTGRRTRPRRSPTRSRGCAPRGRRARPRRR